MTDTATSRQTGSSPGVPACAGALYISLARSRAARHYCSYEEQHHERPVVLPELLNSSTDIWLFRIAGRVQER